MVVPENTAYGAIVTEHPNEEVTLAAKKETDPVKKETVSTLAAVVVPSSFEPTEAIVREYFKDIPVMIQVARCESTFRHTLADGSVLKGRVDNADTGVMQINKRYHLSTATSLGLDLYYLYDNMAYARYLYERQGTQPWSASAPCWGAHLAVN